MELRRHAHNQTIQAVIYTNAALLLATNNSTIVVIDNDGLVVNEIESLFGSIKFFSKHNHNQWSSRPEEVLAVTGGDVNSTSFLLHIDAADGIDSSLPISTTAAVTSLNYCKGRIQKGKLRDRRRNTDDLIVLGIDSLSLQVRDGTYVKTWQVPEGIVDVACYEEDLYVLKGNSHLQLRELDHSEHNGSRLSAFAGLIFIVLILALVGYQLSKRRAKLREQSVQTPGEFELQERMVEK